MTDAYIDREVQKIIENKEFEFPLNVAYAACWITAHYKGENLKLFDMRGKNSLSDFFLLGSTLNSIQAQAIAISICKILKQHEIECISKEGLVNADWVLLDFGDIMIHLFQEQSRAVYDLDTLWANCPTVNIPTEFYISSQPIVEETPAQSMKNYF